MFRPALAALLAAFLISCAPLSPQSDSTSDRGSVYTIRVLNLDWDAKHLWIYCDGAFSAKLEDLALQEARTERLRDTDCRSISFRTEGQGGRELFKSPPLSVPAGATLEITLREYARHTVWRWTSRAAR